MLRFAERIHKTLATAAPIYSIRVGIDGDKSSVTILYDASATPTQKTAAQALFDALDPSQAAQDAWEADQQPERRDLRAAAAQAITDNNTFLAITNPTNAQAIAQTKKLTQQNSAIIRRLVQLD